MTQQAQNCLKLFRGGNPDTIKALLKHQSQSIVNELMEHFNAGNIDQLAVRLSSGF